MKEIETDKILLKIYEEQQQMKKDNEENQKSIVQKIYDVQQQMKKDNDENQKYQLYKRYMMFNNK